VERVDDSELRTIILDRIGAKVVKIPASSAWEHGPAPFDRVRLDVRLNAG
jgi:hypothetical protein